MLIWERRRRFGDRVMIVPKNKCIDRAPNMVIWEIMGFGGDTAAKTSGKCVETGFGHPRQFGK